MIRRTLNWKFGCVKRPSQSFFGSRAIFQIRSALAVWPEFLSRCHSSIDGDSWST